MKYPRDKNSTCTLYTLIGSRWLEYPLWYIRTSVDDVSFNPSLWEMITVGNCVLRLWKMCFFEKRVYVTRDASRSRLITQEVFLGFITRYEKLTITIEQDSMKFIEKKYYHILTLCISSGMRIVFPSLTIYAAVHYFIRVYYNMLNMPCLRCRSTK